MVEWSLYASVNEAIIGSDHDLYHLPKPVLAYC